MKRPSLTRYAWLSIATAVLCLGLKGAAYLVTGSVGMLSDSLESLVNLGASVMALSMLIVAARPADEDHAYGHTKAEYFSSGAEGTLILVAAVGIAAAAVQRLLRPQPIEEIGFGLLMGFVASLLNLGTAMVLLKAGRKYNSITLEADAQHLLTDVWTTGAVLLGVGAAALTSWHWLDPVAALLMAANILRTGGGILKKSISGLMDSALAREDREKVRAILQQYEGETMQFHALRTRQAGARKFVSMHVLVPGTWTVQHGHELLEQIEADIRQVLPDAAVFTHLESLDDPTSYADATLERANEPRHPKKSPPAPAESG